MDLKAHKPPRAKPAGKESEGAGRRRKKHTGLQALYYSYLYQMGVFKKRPQRASFAIQADIRRLDERIAQLDFIQKHGITTREQLAGHRKPLEEQMLGLIKERRRLYRAEPESARIQEITEELKPLRKEVRLCQQIEQHSKEIEERLLAAGKLETKSREKAGHKETGMIKGKEEEKDRNGQDARKR